MNQANTVRKVQDTVIHEVAIHKGLLAAMGEEKLGKLSNDVWGSLSEEERAEVAERWGLDPSQTERIGEEWLAKEAERVARDGYKTNTVWSKIVVGVRRALRALGATTEFSDREIADLVAKGIGAVAAGRRAEGGATKLSVTLLEQKAAAKVGPPNPHLFKGLGIEDRLKVEAAQSKILAVAEESPEAMPMEIQEKKGTRQASFKEFELPSGKKKREVAVKQVPYGIHKPPGNEDRTEAQVVERYARATVVEVRGYSARPDIASAQGWYGRMRKFLQRNFGASMELFGQLLGATSARNKVKPNFEQSLLALREYSKGSYDGILDRFNDHVQTIFGKSDEQLMADWREKNKQSTAKKPKRDSEFDAERERVRQVNLFTEMPRKPNGALFGFNSRPVLHALYGIWLRTVSAPKTPNFTGNLTGRTLDPTIDVWAARFLRRLMFGHQAQWRIRPDQEGGVTDLEFAFAQKVMIRAADMMGINADDLQALAWFIEKDVWETQGWAKEADAEKGDFLQEAGKMSTRRIQSGVTTFKTEPTFVPERHAKTKRQLRRVIGKDAKTVLALRVTLSNGMFMGGKEPNFDIEATLDRNSGNTDADVALIAGESLKGGRATFQEDVLISEVVDKNHPNARPMVEVGFKSPPTERELNRVIKAFTDQGIDGFTVARDERGAVLGIRSQYVPEFFGGEHLDPVAFPANSEQWANDVRTAIANLPKNAVSYAEEGFVSSVVIGEESTHVTGE